MTAKVLNRWLDKFFIYLCLIIFFFHKQQYSMSQNVSSIYNARSQSVSVFYFMSNNWGDKINDGDQKCPNIRCNWTQSENLHHLEKKYHSIMSTVSANNPTITTAVYNIHSLWSKHASRVPLNCGWRTNLTLAASEESTVRYHHLFNTTFHNFDGFSTNHPSSAVQRIHKGAYLEPAEFRENMYNFSYLIKAGTYVAKDCHKKDSANANRDGVVHAIREAGFRIEGLAKCMKTSNPEGVVLSNSNNPALNLVLKREAIGRFMFNMAFENSIEDGYVTEKPFDALLAGTVPVYLGDASHLKTLLPHPKAAIFVADFNGSYSRLAEYLTYLSTNETAYESHREWRKSFTYEANIQNKPLLQSSWYCAVCRWALENAATTSSRKSDAICLQEERTRHFHSNIEHFEGMSVRTSSSHEIFLVANGTLRSVPDVDTLDSLHLSVDSTLHVQDAELKQCEKGEPMPPIGQWPPST